MATMWAQITTIVSAEPWVFVLNAFLLVCEGVAAGCVAAGIVWESASVDTWRRRLSHKLVIWGVVAEVVFSLALFISDEIVSGSQLLEIKEQQSKIIALEEKLAPRDLSPDQIKSIADRLRSFGEIHFDLSMHVDAEPMRLTDKIEDALLAAGWREQQDTSGVDKFNRGNRPPVANRTVGGVRILYPNTDQDLVNAGSMLVWALRNEGIATGEFRATQPLPSDIGVIHVWIGVKP
jgi:hypothetical protein